MPRITFTFFYEDMEGPDEIMAFSVNIVKISTCCRSQLNQAHHGCAIDMGHTLQNGNLATELMEWRGMSHFGPSWTFLG